MNEIIRACLSTPTHLFAQLASLSMQQISSLLFHKSDVRTGAGQLKGRLRELQEAIAQLHTQLDAVQVRMDLY